MTALHSDGKFVSISTNVGVIVENVVSVVKMETKNSRKTKQHRRTIFFSEHLETGISSSLTVSKLISAEDESVVFLNPLHFDQCNCLPLNTIVFIIISSTIPI